jgi:polyhydroxybutyrate depolymerase
MRRMLLALFVACTSGSTPQMMDAGDDAAAPVLGGSRPLQTFRMPENWDRKTPLPLLLVVHGYGIGGLAQALYFNVLPLVEEKQILLAAPDGLFDSQGKRYWNAVDTCCDFDHTNVDDVKYLTDLVEEIASTYPVDRKRVYVIGHSNGGAMTLRLACDRTSTFAAALELAGPFWSNPQAKCSPSAPIPLRVLHGTADMEVLYGGDPVADGGLPASPGAVAVTTFFAQKNGCSAMLDTMAPPLDLDSTLAGAETKVSRGMGCPAGADVELWSIEGAGHIPVLVSNFRNIVWDFLSAHTR